MYQDWVAIPTLVCSTLSWIATGAVITLWAFSNHEEKHSFRYALIMNLTLAEFINSFNNSISGSMVVASQRWLESGIICDINGWVGQVSVQAADFSVLAIAIVSLLTINFNPWIMHASTDQQRLICLSTWLVPFITAFIALFMNKIEPVTGNWCWIAQEPTYLRYALGHGWRAMIFLAVLGIYLSIFLTVRLRLSRRNKDPTLQRTYSFAMFSDSATDVNAAMVNKSLICGHHTMPTTVRKAVTHARTSPERDEVNGLDSHATQEAKYSAQQRLGIKPQIRITQSSKLDHNTRHWLLLSLFPLAYIVVWIPGLANRFAELSGYNSQWLIGLQATTQLTGVVNAMVYGFKQQWHRRRGMKKTKKQAQERTTLRQLDTCSLDFKCSKS